MTLYILLEIKRWKLFHIIYILRPENSFRIRTKDNQYFRTKKIMHHIRLKFEEILASRTFRRRPKNLLDAGPVERIFLNSFFFFLLSSPSHLLIFIYEEDTCVPIWDTEHSCRNVSKQTWHESYRVLELAQKCQSMQDYWIFNREISAVSYWILSREQYNTW